MRRFIALNPPPLFPPGPRAYGSVARGGVGALCRGPERADPAVGTLSAAGRLHSASTVAPCLPPTSRIHRRNQRKTVSLLLSNRRRSPPAGARESREVESTPEKERRRKNKSQKGVLVVNDLIQLKDYSALSQSFSSALFNFPSLL